MIIQADKESYIKDMADIYNSANLLFSEKERGAAATPDLFWRQWEQDENYLYVDEKNEVKGFMPYKEYETYCELTSLYIRLECQNEGIGARLLLYFEEKCSGKCKIIDVLNNAPWALRFYQKNGYAVITDEVIESHSTMNMKRHPWSTVLYKE